MLKNYIKIAWRNLRNDKLYSVINILGIAVATAAFLLIINFVRFEYSYEDFHTKADDIYRVTLDLYQGSEYIVTDAETYPPLGPLLKQDMPEVVEYVRIQMMESIREISHDNEVYRVDKVFAADPSLFEVFNYEFLYGEAGTVFSAPMQVVINESLADRLFGSAAGALDKVMMSSGNQFTITGIIKDPPSNTHLKVNMLLSLSTVERLGWDLTSWNSNNNYTYLQLQPGVDLASFNNKLVELSDERLEDEILVAEPVKDIHLYSNKTFEPEVNGNIKTVQFLFVIAILILIIGSINYMNLTSARATERIKEVGIRKVLGSSRRLLVGQFLTETLLINVVAIGLALQIVQLVLPYYFQLIGRPVDVDFFISPFFWMTCLSLFLFNSLLSGLYPAFKLSGVKPIAITRRTFTGSGQGELFRKALVVGQFTVAMIVLSASFIVFRQISYMQNQDLGVDTSQVLIVRGPSATSDSSDLPQAQVFKDALAQLTDVENVSASEALPGVSLHDLNTTSGLTRLGSNEEGGYTYYAYGIDADFIDNMEIRLVAGRNFRKGSSNKDEMILSEEATRLLGFENPEAAVGERLNWGSTIVGVVKDYHQMSLKESILPMVHWYDESGSFFSIKLKTDDIRTTVSRVESLWSEQFPGYPFDYYFFDEYFNRQYQADQRFGTIVGVFSGFTLFITCLGLLGLTAYTVSRRTKEIGIRKILGATVFNMVSLLSKDFIKLVLIAILIATPTAWYIMSQWLQDFAYKIELQLWMFLIVGLIAVTIALFTVSFQSVRAAIMNPVESLRSE
ncbi:MAG: ABC transporter permease [Gracilimonas sp.]